MGIRSIHFKSANTVKSYLQSPTILSENIANEVLRDLSRPDSIGPAVHVHARVHEFSTIICLTCLVKIRLGLYLIRVVQPLTVPTLGGFSGELNPSLAQLVRNLGGLRMKLNDLSS
jgi:hypothetical protein